MPRNVVGAACDVDDGGVARFEPACQSAGVNGAHGGGRRGRCLPRPGHAALARVDRIDDINLPAHLCEPRGGHVGAHAVVIGQHDARAAHGGGVIGFLHELAAGRAGKAGQVAGGVFLGRAHVELVDRAVRGLQFGNVSQRNTRHVGAFSHGARIGLCLRACFDRHLLQVTTAGAMVEHLIGQQPADGAIAQCRHRVGDAGIHERLRADDAARASRAIDDDLRGRVRCQLADAQHQLGTRHARRRGDAHGLKLFIAARIDDHHVAPGIKQRLDFLRAERRRVAVCLHVFAKGFARHVHVLEHFAAGCAPAIEFAFEQVHARIAEFSQLGRRARGEVHAIVHAVQHDQRIAARNARPRFQLQPGEREVGCPQRMRLGIRVFLADVDQRDLLAGQQGGAHVGIRQRRDVGFGQRCSDRRFDGVDSVDDGAHDAGVSLERSQRLGRWVFE